MNKKTQISKKSILDRISRGIIVYKAPLGYKHALSGSEASIVFDEEKANIVKDAFILYANSMFSVREVSKKLEQQYNIPFARSTVHKILRNPFYAGRMVVKGKEYRHRYPVLVDELTFNKVQKKLNTKRTFYKNPQKKLDFAFRKLLSCDFCDGLLTAERHKEKFVYYRCNRSKLLKDHSFMPVKEESVISALTPICVMFDINPDIFQNPTESSIFCKTVFKHIAVTPDRRIKYELNEHLDRGSIGRFFNSKTINIATTDDKNIQKAIHSSLPDHPIVHLCKTPHDVDTICEVLELDVSNVMGQLMDLELNNAIEQTEDGKWQTKIK